MLTLQDCLGICELTPDQIDAIAEHEHVPELVAAALGEYLIHRDDGVPCIKQMIIDDLADAKTRGDSDAVRHLTLVLGHFIATHPDARGH